MAIMNVLERIDAGIEEQRLFIDGHNVRKGWVIALEYSMAPPVRFMECGKRARRLVRKFNAIAKIRIDAKVQQ